MNEVDRNGPPDGDFAAYVEQLSGNTGAPGRVEPAAGSRSGQAGRPLDGPAAGQAPAPAPGQVGRRAMSPSDLETLRAAARATGLRLSRWFAIGGIALVALSLLAIVPRMSPLPGLALLLLSFFVRKLSRR